MRSRLLLALAGFLAMVILTSAFVRWFYFSQAPHPFVRLSEERFPRLTDRLVIVLVDSVPFNMAFDPQQMPFLASLRQRATWGEARTEEPTMTGQMVYTIATGARPYLYGVVRNWRQNRMPHETFFDGLSSAGLRLHLYGDVPWVEMFGDRFDRIRAMPEESRTAAGRPVVWEHAVNELDRWVIRRLDHALVAPAFDVLLWHLHGTDLVMHKYLRDSVLTTDKLRWADLLLFGLVRQLDDGHTTFLLLSDHGCAENGRHGYQDPDARPTFYALFGPKIVRGQRQDIWQVDFSSTLSALFGQTPAAPSAGRPLVEGLAIPPRQRAKRLVAAAVNRYRYLSLRERRLSSGLRPDPRLLRAGQSAAFKAGHYDQVSRQVTALLRAAHVADLDARRERRLAGPLLFWLLGGLALGAWGVLLARTVPPQASGAAAGRAGHLLVAALVLVITWALGLLGSRYAGRLFNDHIDLWPPLGRLGLWAGFGGAVVAAGWLGRKRVVAAVRAQPLVWAWTLTVVAAVLPGYFQGVYSPVLLMAGLALLLLPKPQQGRRPFVAVALGLVLLGVALVWEYHWRPWFYFTRDYVEQGLGAALAAAGFGVALAAVGRPWRRWTAGEKRKGPGLLWAGLVLTALVGLRHLLWPGPARFHVPTTGDHLLVQLHVKAVALAVFAGAWLGLRRLGLRGREGAVLGALALLCAWGSPFEALVFALLTAALAPLGRARWLAGPGLAPAAAAALCLVAARSVFAMPHEFHFNFTAVHDLMRFAADMDTVAGPLAGPVLVRYTLPALVLLPLLWGRLDDRQQLTALLLSLLYAGARALHLLVVVRLTIDQLYANWRGVGELILIGLWAIGLAVAFTVWWIGGWADGVRVKGRKPTTPLPTD